jgi:hypothetical protein
MLRLTAGGSAAGKRLVVPTSETANTAATRSPRPYFKQDMRSSFFVDLIRQGQCRV